MHNYSCPDEYDFRFYFSASIFKSGLVTALQKKSPEDNQPSPGDWDLGRDDQAFNRTILTARKKQRGKTMKGIDPNSHNS